MGDPRTSSSRQRTFAPGDRVGVLLPLPLAGTYDYLVAEGQGLAAGDFVEVPLGSRTVAGVVWGAGADAVAAARMKPVIRRLEAPPLPEVSRRFVDWVADYTLYPPGAVLRMVASVRAALEPPKPVKAYAIAGARPDIRMTPARRRVLAVLEGGPPLRAPDLAREAAVGTQVIRGLAAAGVLETLELPPAATLVAGDWKHSRPRLSPDQAAAAEDLVAKAGGGGFTVTLLDGVPGSGKTEVYFDAVSEVLARGRQALVLLPEIALSAQWLTRFRQRFGGAPQEWHSELTASRRRHTWRAVAEGRAGVVVGARSALFLPFPDLGLIVVDEEHDAAYKQEDGVVYNARDMAVVRGRLGDLPVVLASATPSLETVVNAERGRYQVCRLPDRHGGAPPPEIVPIDMRGQAPGRGRWISPTLERAIGETLARGEQAMLFLNRRGYAPLTLCRVCGHRMECPGCTAWLVEHRLAGRLQCHHCGYSASLPGRCPSCDAADSLAPCGPGVERLDEEVEGLFPEARRAIAASDTLTGPSAAQELVRRIEEREIDLIIGTQIVAKGYHFPYLTLVGAIDADLGLSGGDLRAAERTFQLLYQVAGRAGRAERPGRVLFQTYLPEEPVMVALAAGDRDRFLAAEAADRRDAGMPPFGRLVAFILSSPDEQAVDLAARALRRAAPRGGGIEVLGPAPAPLAMLRGRHRRRLLLKAGLEVRLRPIVRRWLAAAPPPRRVRLRVDVDPYSFL